MTSYDGTVFYGVTADRDLVPDADMFAPASTRPSTSCSTPSATPARGCRAVAGSQPKAVRKP